MNSVKWFRKTKANQKGDLEPSGLLEPQVLEDMKDFKPSKPSKSSKSSKSSKFSKSSKPSKPLVSSSQSSNSNESLKIFRLGNIVFFVICICLVCFSLVGLYHYRGFITRNNGLGVKVEAHNLAEVYSKSPELRSVKTFVVEESW